MLGSSQQGSPRWTKAIGAYGIEPHHVHRVIATFTVSLEEVLKNFVTSKPRLQCYIDKGISCIRCGTTADRIVMSYDMSARPGENPCHKGIHIDLFAGNVMMTVDHIHPRSKGGPDHIDNYQPMCYSCNMAKGADADEGTEELARQIRRQRPRRSDSRCDPGPDLDQDERLDGDDTELHHEPLRERLHGGIHLVLGGHDRQDDPEERQVEGQMTDIPEHVVLDGRIIAFFNDLPFGTQYYMERHYQDDPGASPHTRGVGSDDANRARYNHDAPVIIHKWPQQEDQT